MGARPDRNVAQQTCGYRSFEVSLEGRFTCRMQCMQFLLQCRCRVIFVSMSMDNLHLRLLVLSSLGSLALICALARCARSEGSDFRRHRDPGVFRLNPDASLAPRAALSSTSHRNCIHHLSNGELLFTLAPRSLCRTNASSTCSIGFFFFLVCPWEGYASKISQMPATLRCL